MTTFQCSSGIIPTTNASHCKDNVGISWTWMRRQAKVIFWLGFVSIGLLKTWKILALRKYTSVRIVTPIRFGRLQIVPTYPLSTATMMSDSDPYELRAKYTHFRILVIGRANAGKTTLLQRVCNTTEDPCIYDDDKNLVSIQRSEDNESWFWRFQLAWTYFCGTSLTIDI